MDEAQVYAKLADIFHDVFDEDVSVYPELSADDVDGWDSLTHLRLILTVQKAFDVRFSAAEIGGLENVGDMVRLIQSKLG